MSGAGGAGAAKPSVAFFVCCEPGPLEGQTILFAKSLRRFGGRFAECGVHAYKPRAGGALDPATVEALAELDVEIHDEVLNTRHHDYPFANKIYAGVAAERDLAEDVVVFLDTDSVILNPPEAFDLAPDVDVCAAPAWHVNKASKGPGHRMEDYWQELYELAGVTDPPWVETMQGGVRIRGYWNAGILCARRSAGIFAEWMEMFERLEREERFPDGRKIVIDQIAQALVICRRPDRFANVSRMYNFDIGRRNFFKGEMRQAALSDIVHVHYHQWFNRPHFLDDVRPAFEADGERREWLDTQLPLEPTVDAEIPTRENKKQKGVRGWLRKRQRQRALHRARPTKRS